MKSYTVSPPPRTSSFSLAALFFLLALAAVLLAILLPALRTRAEQQIGGLKFAGAALGVGFFASVLGGMIGLFHYRRLRGLGWGVLTGLLTGICIGPVVLSHHYDQVVATCLGGSVLLVALAILYRLHES